MVLSLSALQQHEENTKMFSAPPNYQVVLRIKTLCHESVAKTLSEAEKWIQSRLSYSLELPPVQFREEDDHWSEHDHWMDNGSDWWHGGFEPDSDDYEMHWNHSNGTGSDDSDYSGEASEHEERQGKEFLEEDAWGLEDANVEHHTMFRQVNVSTIFSGIHFPQRG